MTLLDKKPSRIIGTSRSYLTGSVSLDSGGMASFESSLERDWLVALDFDPAIKSILEQPFSLQYMFEGKKRRYTPDVIAEFARPDGVETVVYEVKPREMLRVDWARHKAKFKAAIHYCRARGWRFKIVTEKEIRTSYLENAKFLRRYRNLPDEKLICDQLLYTFKALGPSTPQALLAAAYWPKEDQMKAIPMVWKMITDGRIGVLLHEPLTMSSEIWLGV
jgi:hypothetical protein